jgi:hypothetical protein
MAPVSVIIPFRGDGGHRDRIWAVLSRRWLAAHPDWELIVGSAPPGPWRKALAVRDGLPRATADTVVVADGDVWSDAVGQAVDHMETHQWAIPHGDVRRLNPTATAMVLDGADFSLTAGLDQRPYRGHPGGGIVVARRDTIDQVPMDPRFAGWGQEDDSWGVALRTLAGWPWRANAAPLWHLWHPPAERLNRRVGNEDGDRLFHRYMAARKKPESMRELLEEIDATEAA